MPLDMPRDPFSDFAVPFGGDTPLRRQIRHSLRTPEAVCVKALLAEADLPQPVRASAKAMAERLIAHLRSQAAPTGVQALVQEYALSSQEGVALMCLAEALLRIPDIATRDALIRDKISGGDWLSHLGEGRSLFVNAATWGLVVTGKLTQTTDDRDLLHALSRLVARMGEPVIRRGVDIAMRLMGEQFVTGQSISEALASARPREALGFQFSYDMLGEAAMTAADAARYLADYVNAIHEIGRASAKRGVYNGPGISIKLSALHPRYARAQADRVLAELLPRVRELARLSRHYDIGFNIDAEEADRLDLSLDILTALAEDADLSGWHGLGFVVQAYGKRCPRVVDFIIDLARRTQHRIMVRLVKGAYWDAEIKRAQVEGLDDFPVYTRKDHTDLAYLVCAKKLLAARDHVFPQFATHNAQSLATLYHLAGPEFHLGDYEFQCLHGMGEPLYGQIVGTARDQRPCRIYAPVGTHETLLAYLVRRLLENGANSSFVHRIHDPAISIAELVTDPVERVQQALTPGQPHDKIACPPNLFDSRQNSRGLDLSDDLTLQALKLGLASSARQRWQAGLLRSGEPGLAITNPADRRDKVGEVWEADLAQVEAAVANATQSDWTTWPVAERSACLRRAADLLSEPSANLIGLLIREAGKSATNAVAEVREAVDFLRYYAIEAEATLAVATPLGPVACISPWNFPLAIFVGQIAAALAAGNPVLAKPAEETPLIAAEAVRLLKAAGIPAAALHLLPGPGEIGAALVASPGVQGVVFTGSTDVARRIQGQLADRLSHAGKPIPLIAETGGQNAMIVDSSALAEQVAADVVASAFDSAGQRCSALRILCLQEDIAERTLAMIKGAMAELKIAPPTSLASDIGPVITREARDAIEAYISRMRDAGHKVHQTALGVETAFGDFVPPTLIEIANLDALGAEIFGPVLHVLRYARTERDSLIEAINQTGFGLTFGLHSRLDSAAQQVMAHSAAGNIYINRNTIGAVVGVQPFGGRGLSGTGPKAGGPLYLSRLVAGGHCSRIAPERKAPRPALEPFFDWLSQYADPKTLAAVQTLVARATVGLELELPGAVGERNLYRHRPKGRVALAAKSTSGFYLQLGAVLATGNQAVVIECPLGAPDVPPRLAREITMSLQGWTDTPDLAAALVEGDAAEILRVQQALAARPGPIVPLHVASTPLAPDSAVYDLDRLVDEVSISINTTAAGGNAHLMALA